MVEKVDRATREPNWGLPVERFQKAVASLVELRDRGRFVVFLPRRNRPKLVGDVAEFLDNYRKLVGQSGEESLNSEAAEALGEIQRILRIALRYQDSDHAVRHMEQTQFPDQEGEQIREALSTFREEAKGKLGEIRKHLLTPRLRERAARLKSVTISVLEDVDFEIIERRFDSTSESDITGSHVRLRIRYSENQSRSPFAVFLGDPWEEEASSFELECDESDIDVLISRLSLAKHQFLKKLKPPDNQNG